MPLGPPDLSTTASRFAFLATRRRYTQPTVTGEGLPQDAAPTDSAVLVHSWPASPETVERLLEGVEGRDTIEGTAVAVPGGAADFVLGDRATGRRADSLVLDALEYEVVSTNPRRVTEAGVVTWSTFVAAQVRR